MDHLQGRPAVVPEEEPKKSATKSTEGRMYSVVH